MFPLLFGLVLLRLFNYPLLYILHMKTLIACLAFSSALVSGSFAAISVTWGNSNETYTFADSKGVDLSTGSLILLGTFSAQTDFVTFGKDLAYLQSHFTSFDSASIGSGGYGELDGYFVDGATVAALSTPLYYWVFNASTAAGATEWGVVTSAAWVTPANDPDILITDLDQAVASGAKVGSLNTAAGKFQTLVTSAVPEPSSFAAIAGLSILGVVAARRRRSA